MFGLASYAAMALYRPACGYMVFAGSFGYLIYIHATSASGEEWKAGPSRSCLPRHAKQFVNPPGPGSSSAWQIVPSASSNTFAALGSQGAWHPSTHIGPLPQLITRKA